MKRVVMNWEANQVVERTAAPRVCGEGGSPRAAFAHYRRSAGVQGANLQ